MDAKTTPPNVTYMIYQNVQHKKEMVLGLPDRPFKGQRPQERPKSFLAFGSRAADFPECALKAATASQNRDEKNIIVH